MTRFFKALSIAGLLICAGCNAGGLTPDQKLTANRQWNDARASVLASLALDQFKNGNFDKCQDTIDQALRLEPENANLHLLAAKLAIEQGKLEIAQAHLVTSQKIDPENAEADYLNGVVMQRWHQSQKAFECYTSAARKNVHELAYVLAQAEMLVELEKPLEASVLLESKAANFEHSGVLRDEQGEILMQLHKPREAVAAFRDAVVLCIGNSTVREHLGFALLADRQFSEAAEVLTRLSKDPDYSKRADILVALGDCQMKLNQLNEAHASYSAAVQLQPGAGNYWLSLARLELDLKEFDSADRAVRRAIALDPANADAQCLLGYVRLKQNQLPASLAAFKEAGALDPTDSTNLCLQGFVLQRMGKIGDAKACLTHALKVNPKDELAGKLLASLDPKN